MTETQTAERVGAGETIKADTAPLPVRVDAPDGGRYQWDPNEELKREPLYNQVSPQMLGVLRAKWRRLSEEEIAMALEVAGALRLNPWTGEIHAGKGQPRDGEEGRLLIMVGRDGLLRKAEEFPDYLGYDGGIVYSKDHFEKGDPDPDSKTMRGRAGVSHRQGHPKERGELIGAWAVAERRGRPVRYFFALWGEYNRGGKTPWSKTMAAMIEKVPISYVHRTLINLSGVYLEEEVDHVLNAADVVQLGAADGSDLPWPPTETGERMRAAWLRLRESAPGAWPLAKMEMILPGIDEEHALVVAVQMEEEAKIAEDRNAAEMGATMQEEAIAELEALDDDALKLRYDECESGCDNTSHVPLIKAILERRGIEIPPLEGEPEPETRPPAAEAPPADAEVVQEPVEDPERPRKGEDPAKLREELDEILSVLTTAKGDPEAPVDVEGLEQDRDVIEEELRLQAAENPDQGSML